MCFSKLLITILEFNQIVLLFYSFYLNYIIHILFDCLIGHVPPDQGIAQVIRVAQIYAAGLVQE